MPRIPEFVKRWSPVLMAVVVGVAALFVWGPSRVRPWECRDTATGVTARDAASAYYASCWWGRPHSVIETGEGAGASGFGGEEYKSWDRLASFRLNYGRGRIRFLRVGRRTPEKKWTTIQGEGTGP